MGAGASTAVLPLQASGDELAALANTTTPISQIPKLTKEIAVRLKTALTTPEGWTELQNIFDALDVDLLDDAISSFEWGQVVAQHDSMRQKYFGDATAEEIAEQFDGLDVHKRSALTFEQFVDGAMSLGVAVSLAEALATSEGDAELREFFDTIEADENRRVPLDAWAAALLADRDVLAYYTGMAEDISARFNIFFMTGKVELWIQQAFRRLGLIKEELTWEEFRACAQTEAGEFRSSHGSPGTSPSFLRAQPT